MEIEYEATFENINKDEIRKKLKNAGATLVKPEFLQKRIPFYLPGENVTGKGFARVRDEGDKITMSYKLFDGDKIENQKELCIEVSDFDKAVELLELLGCKKKSYQESKREIWKLDEVEIMIDEWPFLEPFVEVEGKSEEEVRKVSEKVGFDYSKALFSNSALLYQKKYNISNNKINVEPLVVFDMENPFLKYL